MRQLTEARERWLPWVGTALIVLVGLAAYRPTLAFNFFWEDPFDIGQVEPYSYPQLLSVANSNSYYRPLALVILKALKLGAPTYQAWPYHLFVVAGHLASGALLFGMASFLFVENRPDKSRKPAGALAYPLAAGLVYVLYPLPYEATARASSMHEWLTAAMFASFWLFASGRTTRRRWPLLVALILMAFAQLLHENGLLFPALVLLLEAWLVWQKRVERFSPLALLYCLPAAVFFAIWLTVPKGGETPQVGIHLREALYLSQAISFPFAGPIAWLGGLGLTPGWQAGLALPLAVGMLLLAHGRKGAPRLALALAWWVGAISLAWLARPIEYLRVSPRVMYFPSFAAALAWAGVVDLGRGWLRPPCVRRAIVAAVLAGVIAVSAHVLQRSTTLYQAGSELMDAIITQGAGVGTGGRALFVNVPDRFRYRQRLFPLGDWGMLLAPVSQDISDFIRFTTGLPVETSSLSDFQLLPTQARESPYEVNTRGVDAFASELLYESALWADATFLTRYQPDGRMWLAEVGAVAAAGPDSPPLARYGDVAQLLSAITETIATHEVRLTLTWQSLTSAQPNDTVFVHLVDADGALAAQADGDSLGGLLPVSAWRTGHVVRDEREIASVGPLAPGAYTVKVGLYNRVDGSRYPATDAAGAPVADGAVRVATVTITERDS